MSRADRDAGHAIVEALLLGLVLLVPVMWMMSVFAELHAAALGTTSAAREGGFEAARSADALTAEREMERIVAVAAADHGLDPSLTSVAWAPAGDWRRGGAIEVVVTYDVPVFQAPLLGHITTPAISVSAKHVTTIDRYRSRDG